MKTDFTPEEEVTEKQCRRVFWLWLKANLDAHIEDCCPNSSHYYGIMVAIPQYAEEVDEYENPTPLEPEGKWKLAVILPCRQGPRRRSLTEMLFYMLRSGR